MVLSLMRRHAKSYIIKFLIAIIAVVFIFYFGYSFRSSAGVKMAYVNGELISGLEYQKAYRDLVEAMRVQYKSIWNENLIKTLDLRNRALDRLINQKLVSYEAQRLGLEVTKDEVQRAIMSYPAFQVNGQFEVGRYRALLDQNRMKPEDFELSISQDLLEKKVREFLMAFVPVTDQEVLDYYTFTHEQIKIAYVEFKPEKFKEKVNPDQAALEKYFKEHQEDYRVPEKIKVAYLVIDPKDFKEQVRITDQEIKDYYEAYLDTFKQEKQVRARHILFKLDENASEAEEKKVREKAKEVLKEAREGKDFASLAKKYSEGPTKSKGGDLGYFGAGKMVKSFEEAAFKMKAGEISDLVRTRFGYHIIKVEDVKEARTKSLEEVRNQIIETLTRNLTTELAHEKALSIVDRMPYDVDLAKYAAENGLQTQTTGAFSEDQPIPGIGGTPLLRQGLFALGPKETSEVSELGGKFYIFQVVDRIPSYLPEMKEVSDRLKEDVTLSLAAKEARNAAEKYLDDLHKGKSWEALSKEYALTPKESDFFARSGTVPDIGYAPDLTEKAFSLNEGKRYPEDVFQSDKGAFVIRWEARKGIDEEKYREEKQEFRFSLARAQQERIFQSWLSDLRKNARIQIVTPVSQ